METRADQTRALLLTLLLHAVGIVLVWLSSSWFWSSRADAAAGEPITASLEISSADLRRAEQSIADAAKAAREEQSAKPQPNPSPSPQDSDTPLQPKPQAPQDQPDTVDQQAIDRLAIEKAEKLQREQEERTRQEQVDLTEDIERQQEVERRQRAREQLEAIRREREQAAQTTRMEEQRLRQLADRQAANPSPPRDPAPQAGNRGMDEGLLARYIAALNATARANWNRSMAPELVRCKVRFTQRIGGEVMRVEFLECPFDAVARDSVERALFKEPMPYQGFESVYQRQVTLTLCYPEESCQ
ncbi:protein TolA [Arenimonas sp.]|uniref:protein TolA n=1 Tax=Arenimonas sp. TaxID=1872635 RepID=UPI0039E316AD